MIPEYLFKKNQIMEHRGAMEARVKKLARQAEGLSEKEKELFKMALLQNIIDLARGKKELKLVETQSTKIKNAKKNILNKIKEKISNNEKIKVAFLCIYDNVFQYSELYKKMLEDELFEPFILVIPDTLRGEEFMYSTLEKTFKTLSSQYPNVYSSLDKETNEFIDFSNEIDRDPGIVLGRLQKDKIIGYDDWQYNSLRKKYIITIED